MAPRVRTLVLATALAAAVWPVTGCSVFGLKCRGGQASIAISSNGAATPLLAVEQLAINNTVDPLPLSGWHLAGHDANGYTLKSGPNTVHVVTLDGGTFVADSYTSCHY